MFVVLRSLLFGLATFALAGSAVPVSAAGGQPPIKIADIGNGITLHYVDEGHGRPIIFVHGSISFGGYWADQLPVFAKHYRAIAYSRRYNDPNHNPAVAGYSAMTDADDLAAFIHSLHLHDVVIVGHSYGALTALFFQVRHPGLAKALVLAEPPAVSLLKGTPYFKDIQRHLLAPMIADFKAGRREAGVADFVDYVYQNPREWQLFSPQSRSDTMRNAHEWDVMMTRGTLFPTITPSQVRGIDIPVLLLNGEKTYPFLTAIDDDLVRLLPHNQNVVVTNAGHQMWYQAPELCRDVVETFIRWAISTPHATDSVLGGKADAARRGTNGTL